MLRERYGEEYKTYLTFLFSGTEEMELCPQMRYDYMDCVTRLYEKIFPVRLVTGAGNTVWNISDMW